MKNVIILHGTGETKNSFWFPWLTRELLKKGYTVSLPELPNADYPDIKKWLPVALRETYTSETVLIGHSAGGPLQLSVLENINIKIKQAILVSGYARPKGKDKKPELILQDVYNWQKIAQNVKDILFVNSDNDPWGCDDVEGRYVLDHIEKGKLIVMKGEGHMGSDTFKQPYKKFPFLLKLIDL
ncbi:MAG: alpha/beta fold hydrolase [Patescibacteria group bacterium]